MLLIIFPILFQEISSEFLTNFDSNTTNQNFNEKEIEICCSGRNCTTLGDGFCDIEFFNEQCLWDRGDCLKCHKSCTFDILFDGKCQQECFNHDCIFDIDDCDGRRLIKIKIPDEKDDYFEFYVNYQKIKVSKHMESNFGPLRFNNLKKLDGYFNYDSESKIFNDCSLTFSGEFFIHDLQINEKGIENLNISVQDYGKIVMENINFINPFSANFEIVNESVVISDLYQKEASLNITMNYKLNSNQILPKRIFHLKSQPNTIFTFNLSKESFLNFSTVFLPSSFNFIINSNYSSISIESSSIHNISLSSSHSSTFINTTNLLPETNFLTYFKSSNLTIIESLISGCLDQFKTLDPSIELIGVSFNNCLNSNIKRINHLTNSNYSLYSFLQNCSDGHMDAFGCTQCPDGYYRFKHMSSKMCFKCPKSMKCEKGKIWPNNNYYRFKEKNFHQVFRPCLNKNACSQDENSHDTKCRDNYKGRLCASCDKNTDSAGRYVCSKCPDIYENVFVIILTIFLISSFIIYLIKSTVLAAFMPSEFYAIALRIGINYFQVIYLCLQFKIRWPGTEENEPEDDGTNVADRTNLYYSIKCLMEKSLDVDDKDYLYIKIWFMALLPIIIFLFSLCYLVVLRVYMVIREKHYNLSIYKPITYTVPFLLIYPYVITYSLLPLACNNLVEGKPQYFDEEVDLTNYEYLISNPDIMCTWDEHYKYIVWATGFSLIIWGIFVPCLIFYKLYLKRKNLFEYKVKYTFGFLINGYKHERFYWEFIIFIKKLVIVFLTVFMQSGYSVTLQSVLLITFLILGFILQLHFKPYITEQLNNLEIFGSLAAIITVLSAIIYSESFEQSKFLITILAVLIALVNIFYILYWASFLSKEFYYYLIQNIEYLKKRYSKQDGFGDISKEWEKLNFVYYKEFQKLYTQIEYDLSPPPNYLGESQSYLGLMKKIVECSYENYTRNIQPSIKPFIRKLSLKMPSQGFKLKQF